MRSWGVRGAVWRFGPRPLTLTLTPRAGRGDIPQLEIRRLDDVAMVRQRVFAPEERALRLMSDKRTLSDI